MQSEEKKKKQARYLNLKRWRERNKEKARAIQARYYYSRRTQFIEENGFRLPEGTPGARGPFDPQKLRVKSIYIDTILSGPFRGMTASLFDFNESLSSMLFTLETIKPRKNSFRPTLNERPNLPANSENNLATLDEIVEGGVGMSSTNKCAISFALYFLV